MAHFLPVLLALILNCSGIYIFTSPKRLDCLPYVSYVLFSLSLFFLLWDLNLKPCSLRGLYKSADYIIEFVLSMFLMETIMVNFWFPLEMGFIKFLPKVPGFATDLMYSFGLRCTGPCEYLYILKSPETVAIASCILSLFFLLCVIHATRIIHFGVLMKCCIPICIYLLYDSFSI